MKVYGKKQGRKSEQNKGMKEKRVESSISKRLVRSRCRLTIISLQGPVPVRHGQIGGSSVFFYFIIFFVTDVIRSNIRGCELFF